ncbi:MAG: hypothetical protein WC821_04340 [archaeon]|jgi:hypothetical protein
MVQDFRISPYFSKEQTEIIDKLIGKIGCTRADVVKQLVLIRLTEMGYFDKKPKQ